MNTTTSPHQAYPHTHLISNGTYSIFCDSAGAGASFAKDSLFYTRWRRDPVQRLYGTFIYLRDLDSGRLWSATYLPTCQEPETYEVHFHPRSIEFKRMDFQIRLRTEITVPPEDAAELRHVTLFNEGLTPRRLELTSYAEVSLDSLRGDSAHPAFSKMFIESEFLPEVQGLLFSRRPRSVTEGRRYLVHKLCAKRAGAQVACESSREAFLGRGRSAYRPRCFERSGPLSGTVGPVLDPCFALQTLVELKPGESQELVFVTAAADSRAAIDALAKRFHAWPEIVRAFAPAPDSGSEKGSPQQLEAIQRLANAVLYPLPSYRSLPESVARNRLTQSALWRFGISGDIPVVLLSLSERAQLAVARQALLAHSYLRACLLEFDLVILSECASTDLDTFQRELEGIVKESPAAALIDKKSGIFLRTRAQLSEEEHTLLLAYASANLGGASNAFAGLPPERYKMNDVIEEHSLEWGKGDEQRSNAPGALECDNSLGGFVDHGRAYRVSVSADRLPPAPWVNVAANPQFGFLVAETGSGYTWSENSRENRLSPWNNDPVSDPSGEFALLADAKRRKVWSLTPLPGSTRATYGVTHAFGESTFQAHIEDVAQELVTHGSPVERAKWCSLQLVNTTAEARELHLFLYIQPVLGALPDETQHMLDTSVDDERQALFVQNHYNNEFAGRAMYLCTDRPFTSFTCDRGEFFGAGRGPYDIPRGVERVLSGSPLGGAAGVQYIPCLAVQIRIELGPGQSERINWCIGESPSIEDGRNAALRLRSGTCASQERERLRAYWLDVTNTIQVKTPERSFDILMNGWLLYQTLSCRLYGRSGFYQSGGALGYRDQLQDSLALLASTPEKVRAQILLHASRQFVEGDVQHWWHPPTGKGVRTKFSDDLLWLPYATSRYLEVTGDHELLNEAVPFLEGPLLEPQQTDAYYLPRCSEQTATVYEHCIRAIERAARFGSHGLPLMGSGDWNDGMSEVGVGGRGESVWLGWFLLDVLRRISPLLKERGESDRLERYAQMQRELAQALETHAWDGDWYRRAFFDDGSPLGSRENEECKIDSIAQSWATICGRANPERAEHALEQALRHLVREDDRLVLLLTPPFNTSAQEPGYIKGYLPGIRENGGQYTHASVWLIVACALRGRGADALRLFNLLNPIEHTRTPKGVERYRTEPYVLCGDVYSVPPHAGRGGWSWYTGSSSWLYHAGTEHILGLKLYPRHFEVSPCVAPAWRNFSFTYTRRGCTYAVAVENPRGVERGVKRVEIDGVETPSGKVEFVSNRPRVEIRVIMG